MFLSGQDGLFPNLSSREKTASFPSSGKVGFLRKGKGLKVKKNNAFLPRVINIQIFKYGVFIYLPDGPKDTSPEDTLQKTYMPSLKTLEEEVMEKLNIQEDRKPRKSYWY